MGCQGGCLLCSCRGDAVSGSPASAEDDSITYMTRKLGDVGGLPPFVFSPALVSIVQVEVSALCALLCFIDARLRNEGVWSCT
jgi:hypothetical protein